MSIGQKIIASIHSLKISGSMLHAVASCDRFIYVLIDQIGIYS